MRIVTCLKRVYSAMLKNHSDRASMVLLMHKKKVNCVFTIDSSPFYLHLAAIGRSDLSAEFSIHRGFTLDSEYVPNLSEWAKFFELKYSPTNHYSGKVFLDEMESEISRSNPKYDHSYSKRIKGMSKKSDMEGTIFCGTYNNPTGKHVTKENYDKTRKAFGKSVADHYFSANISTRWTTDKNKEKLDDIINTFPNLQF